MRRSWGTGTRFKIASFILPTLLVTGCMAIPLPQAPAPVPTVQSCTLIACSDALVVELKGAVPKEYLVEVTAPDGTSLQVQCTDGQFSSTAIDNQQLTCLESGEVVFPDFTPDEVLVTLTWEDGLLIQDLKPVYSPHRPNGPNCEPECQRGVVEFYIP